MGYIDSGTNASLDALVFCDEVIGMVGSLAKGSARTRHTWPWT